MSNYRYRSNQLTGGDACGILIGMYVILPTLVWLILRFGFDVTYFSWWQYVLIIFLFDLVVGMIKKVSRYA